MDCLRIHACTSKKMTMALKLAVPVTAFLLWILSMQAGTFATDTLLPRPITGGQDKFSHRCRYLNGPPKKMKLKISVNDLNQAVSFGHTIVEHMYRLETSLGWSDITVKQGTPSHGQLIESAPETQALIQGKQAFIVSKASLQLINMRCLNYRRASIDCAKHISKFKLNETHLRSACKVRKTCSKKDLSAKYRKLDGSCNHKSSLGQSFTSYKRLLHADYLDGIHFMRRSVNKKYDLPSARLISNKFKKTNDGALDQEHTLALMQWAEFVSHDLAHTVTHKMVHSGKTIECCSPDGTELSPRYIHPFCAQISIPKGDDFYEKHYVRCMSYVRSVSAIRPDCSFGPNEQLNQATHFLDGSQIYGSDERKAYSLRSLEGGHLKSSRKHGKLYLPASINPMEHCQVKSDSSSCYLSGDSRVNVHPHLTAMHTVWFREHNRLAKQLLEVNPDWDDETLYQEARRIVIAEMQHVTYNEFLPEVLGTKYKISFDNNKHDADPSVSNSFATAAIQFVKSLMADKLGLYSEKRESKDVLNLREHFNNPEAIENGGHLDALIRGLATQPSQKLDLGYSPDVTDYLYNNGHLGLDVLSLDIQRGRDHGLPSYTAFRSLCGFPEVESFEDFYDAMPKKLADSLANVYKDPQDVDLIVGGLAENKDGDSLLGPTFNCIVSDQFERTRSGDRYFYGNPNQPSPFTKEQLDQISKITLARILCDNGDDVTTMQENVFKTLSSENSLIDCNSTSIPSLDLNYWKM